METFYLHAPHSACPPAQTTMMAEKSAALPFLERPATLGDGSMAGDVGFGEAHFSPTGSCACLQSSVKLIPNLSPLAPTSRSRGYL
jgi:hypothetical protein